MRRLLLPGFCLLVVSMAGFVVWDEYHVLDGEMHLFKDVSGPVAPSTVPDASPTPWKLHEGGAPSRLAVAKAFKAWAGRF